MQLEEMRANVKMGEDDPALRGDLERAQTQFKEMLAQLTRICIAPGQHGTRAGRNRMWRQDKQKDTMVALLDRRSYLRNLLREVKRAVAAGAPALPQ